MKQTKHWLLTVVLLLCSAAQMSGEIILTQADGLLDGRIKYGDGTTQFIQLGGNEGQNAAVYDMNGRRITDTENLKKGIYIVNGRKVLF